MTRSEIVEGIRGALDKGQNLKDAMMSFFNAGYPREEINEAARTILLLKDSRGNRIYSNEGRLDRISSGAPAQQPSYPPAGQRMQGFPPQGMPPQYPPQQPSYPPAGQRMQGFPPQGMPPQYPPQQPSYPPAGQRIQGFPPQGMPPQPFGQPPLGNVLSSSSPSPSKQPVVQKVSNYSSKKSGSGGKWVLFFFLFLFLLIITAGIVGLIFYKEQIFSYLNI